MNKIKNYPLSLVPLSALIGGVMGAILAYVVIYPGDDTGIALIYGSFFGAVSGVFFGVFSGVIGYAIKPRVWASIIGAVLGGALVPMMCWARAGLSSLSESFTANRLEQMYPESKPIPTLSATFQELTSGDYIESCAVNSDGSRLALGTGTQITLWDLIEQVQIGEFGAQYDKPLAFSPDGHFLTLDNMTPHDLILRDMHTGKQLILLELNEVNNLVFSPDGRLLAAAPLGSNRINLLDLSTGKEIAHIEVPGGPSMMAFSPDGRLLATDDIDGQLILWDTSTLKRVRKLQEAGSVLSLAFSPDGSRLAAGIEFREPGDSTFEWAIGLWDVDTRTRLAGTRAPNKTFNIAFSPDGQRLITTGYQQSDIFLWDANNLKSLGALSRPNAEQSEAYYLPDGRVLACYWNVISPDQIGIWTIESP